MKIYRIKFETTNALNNATCDKEMKHYIDLNNGEIFVAENDLDYIIKNYNILSIKYEGYLFKKETS